MGNSCVKAHKIVIGHMFFTLGLATIWPLFGYTIFYYNSVSYWIKCGLINQIIGLTFISIYGVTGGFDTWFRYTSWYIKLNEMILRKKICRDTQTQACRFLRGVFAGVGFGFTIGGLLVQCFVA